MKNKVFLKKLLYIVLPISVQYFISTSINMADSFMVGRLGDEAVASLGIANQYYFLFNLFILGIYSAGSLLVSQYNGRKEMNNVSKVAGISTGFGIAAGLIFFLAGLLFNKQIIGLFTKDPEVLSMTASYLNIVLASYIVIALSQGISSTMRGLHKTFIPMLASIVGLIVNLTLNVILIFGYLGMPKMGVPGAALATLIARSAELIILIILIKAQNSLEVFDLKQMTSIDKKLFENVTKSTKTICFNELCWGSGFIVYSMIYGYLGTKSLASVQIALGIQNMFLILHFALASGASVIIGSELGSRNIDNIKEYSKKIMFISFVISLAMGAILITSSDLIMTIYKVTPSVVIQTKKMIILCAITLPMKSLNVLLILGILRGGGDSEHVLKIELFTMWAIGVPICYICAVFLKLEVSTIFILVTLEEIVKIILCMKRYKSLRWIHIDEGLETETAVN